MKVLSLFDGISCGMVALERAGIAVERYVAYEIDKFAIKVSQSNYPQIEQCGDVTTADFTQYKGFDLLIGGSPCTYWSVANNNRETTPDGMGGKLFLEYVRALKESGCKYFLYENNNSIHDNIKAFISAQLGVEPITINSAVVSAQRRDRCYWTNIPCVTQPQEKNILLKDILQSGIGVVVSKQGKRIDKTNIEKSYCLLARDYKGFGNQAMTGVLDIVDGKELLRTLTPIESERLQTLPDDYTRVVSNTQRKKQIGNGWTVDVIAHLFKGLML